MNYSLRIVKVRFVLNYLFIHFETENFDLKCTIEKIFSNKMNCVLKRNLFKDIIFYIRFDRYFSKSLLKYAVINYLTQIFRSIVDFGFF